jgi:dihydroxyacid dehydratase/phosphogluconate dehydratase
MAATSEALGMSLLGRPRSRPRSRRQRMAEAVGRQIVSTVNQGIRPATPPNAPSKMRSD